MKRLFYTFALFFISYSLIGQIKQSANFDWVNGGTYSDSLYITYLNGSTSSRVLIALSTNGAIDTISLSEIGLSDAQILTLVRNNIDTSGTGSSANTGWAKYINNKYTIGSPLSISSERKTLILEEGTGSETTYLPSDLQSFFNQTDTTIVEATDGNVILLQIDFIASSSLSGAYANIELYLADSLKYTSEFNPKFTDPLEVSKTFNLPYASEEASKGYKVKIYAENTDLSIYNVSLTITRIHSE